MKSGNESRFKTRSMVADPLEKELSIDSQRLNEEIMDQPLLYKKWSTLAAQVSKKAKLFKLNLEEKEAELYVLYSSDGTGKKVKEIESAVSLNPDIRRLKRDLIDAEELLEQYEGIIRAFYQRHEMLKDLAANARRELID